MKTIKTILVALLMCSASVSFAQKFGSVKQADLVQKMMAKDSIQQKMDAYLKELDDVSVAMNQEFTTKLQEFQKSMSTYAEAVRQQKEKDLQRLQQSIEEFQQTAQQGYTKKQNELMEPVIKQFRDAVAKVGKEGSFLMIFDNSQPLYVSESLVTDVTELVRKVLAL